MYKNILFSILCIIICVVFNLQHGISMLPDQGPVDEVFEVWHMPSIPYLDKNDTQLVPVIKKSEHLSCQHTRAGTPSLLHLQS
jgi:hypothetical protein